ncbi:DNA helicase B [Colossoma macropomum]|uniref:DNA helicase B n=1 Tax=Colossoma macropomum TaxID=42526 RepID=UPI0018649F8C|nr:DNA helicase B [Colossoma macropomum]
MAHRNPPVSLVGHILADKKDDRNADEDSETEEEEEEKQPEFLDMKEMDSVSSGGYMFETAVPAKTEVNFMASGEKCRVEGRFALRDPWWEISCTASWFGHKFVMKGYPSYSLRTHLKKDSRTIVSLFLKACGVNSDFVTLFINWLPENRHVDLSNVEEALNDFRKQSNEIREAADFVISQVSKSAAGFYVRAASRYPRVMKYMPTLLPGKFLNLLNEDKEKEKQETPEVTENAEAPPEQQQNTSILAKLEELIKTDVWKLGFSYIMWKEFRLVRCEANVKAFKACELFPDIPVLQQNALEVYSNLKMYCRNGHTYVDLEHLQERMRKCKMPEESTWKAVDFLRKQGVLKVERHKVALRNFYKYETEIVDCLSKVVMGEPWKINLDVEEVLHSAQRVRMRTKADADAGPSALAQNAEEHGAAVSHEPIALLGSSQNWDNDFKEEPDPTPIELDPDQVRAAKMICANPVTVISGKGGCGKTTVVSLVFKAAMLQQEKNEEAESTCEKNEGNNKKHSPDVLLTAPTGRAASLLTKRTGFTAYTMHQVLWSFMNAKKNQSREPENWKFAQVRVLVVDEGSLVCVQILHSLLTMLTKHAKLQKFILLGDIRQLPSIEPGNTLNDLFQSFGKVKWAIEMRTNHRAESELIVRNAGLIAEMGHMKKFSHLDFDAVVDLSEPFTMPSPDKKFILILLPKEERDDDLQISIKSLLEGPAPGLKDDQSSQFIAFMRSDCALINELCCKHYSGHTLKAPKNKINFQVGDKVCCTRNGYVTDLDQEKINKTHCVEVNKADFAEEDIDGTQKKVQRTRLCNGEIFFIREDLTTEEAGKRGSKTRVLQLSNESGKVVLTADYRELQRECKLRHAWARTIHTFQGSEEKTIVYVLGEGRYQNWKHVYTAVTRGQQRVYVIAKENGLKQAIQGHVINRCTRLAGLVTNLVGKLQTVREDLCTQPSQSQFGTPKRGSIFQPFQSPQQSLPNPGLSQAFSSPVRLCAKPLFMGTPGRNQNSADNGFGEYNVSPSGSPSLSKRQSSTDICATPAKQLKTAALESPLGCSQLEHLCLDGHTPKSHARQLFQ